MADARLQAILQGLQESTDATRKNEFLCHLIEESKTVEFKDQDFVVGFLRVLRTLIVDTEQAIRSQALRTARYLTTNEAIIRSMLKLNIDLFVARALERDSKFLWERMQALKLIRQFMKVAPHLIPRSVVQSLVSIAEHPKDDFGRISLDAIRELVLINPEVVSSCNGIRTIVDSILDTSGQEIAGSLTLTLLFLIDQDSTRKCLRPSLDIAKLLSVFTDTETSNSPEKEARRAAAHKALVTMMRSWTGILCLTSDKNGLRSLIQLLGLPPSVKGSSWAKEAIFDILIEIMQAVKSEDLFVRGNRNLWKIMGPNLLHSYIVIVLLAFMDCGLVQILTKLGMSKDPEFSGVATNLLTEILRLSSGLLPRSICAQLNSLPSVVQQCAEFNGDIQKRVRALTMITGLGGADEAVLGFSSSGMEQQGMRSRRNLSLPSMSRHDRSESRFGLGTQWIERIVFGSDHEEPEANNPGKSRMARVSSDAADDEIELQSMLKKSQVLATKEYKNWDFNLCLTLLRGPLTTQNGLVLTLKTKFIKRLLSFMKPSKNFFADLTWENNNMVHIRVACQLIRVMLNHAEGREYSFFNELITEILKTLASEADRAVLLVLPPDSDLQQKKKGSFAGARAPAKVFNREKCHGRLAREYFSILGILSGNKHGQQILDNNGLYFQNFKDLARVPSTHMAPLLANNLSHTHNLSRELLQYWLQNSDSQLRLIIISKLRTILRSLNHMGQDDRTMGWAIELLVRQLGSEKEVALCALSVLEEAGQKLPYLQLMIALRPDFSVVGAAANNLQISMLASAEGFSYLNSIGWVESQLKLWRADGGGNQKYVETLENALVAALNAQTGSSLVGEASGLIAVSHNSCVPPGHPGQQPWAKMVGLRSATEDYYFTRLHQLPWNIKLWLTKSKRSNPWGITTDAYLYTCYGSEAEGGGLCTFVVGKILEDDMHQVKKLMTDPTVKLKARLSVGAIAKNAGEESQTNFRGAYAYDDATDMEKHCEPEHWQTVTEHNLILMGDGTRWEFEWGANGPFLKAIWFQLPQTQSAAVLLAPHFYGDLARTERGCTMLRASGHFAHFIDTIKSTNSTAIQKRAALWALGQVGSSDRGFSLFEDTGVLEFISDQAKDFHVLSMRGTCFYILGLLSRSPKARRLLARLGWEFAPHSQAGIVVPSSISSFLSLPPVKSAVSWANDPKNIFGVKNVPSKSKGPNEHAGEEVEANRDPNSQGSVVLGHISNLCNHVTQKTSLSALRAMRGEPANKGLFSSGVLLMETLKLLSTYTYRLPARRFILFDLYTWIKFDKQTMETFDVEFQQAVSEERLCILLKEEQDRREATV